MNRFKKYIRTKGIKLESDYPWLPYDYKNITVEGVRVDSENAVVIQYLNVGTSYTYFNCNGVVNYDFD